MKSPRQLYNPSFGSKQRPPSPGFLATNDAKLRIGKTYRLKRGIELPQESDMAVRVDEWVPDRPTMGVADLSGTTTAEDRLTV